MDALTDPSSNDDMERVDRFIAAQAILLSMVGVPGIYIHSLVGSQNWYEGVKQSGINRRINRETLCYSTLCSELNSRDNLRSQVFTRFMELLNIRKDESAFSPNASQKVLFLDSRLLSFIRENKETNEKILVMINVSGQGFMLKIDVEGHDLISREHLEQSEIKIAPYQIRWIKMQSLSIHRV
jgi:sucrose phosphorylase